ncbi:MAG: hypothetical protein ACI4A8_09080 [Muribaculaceae bacterium]
MKKLIFLLVVALAAISASAQTTFNIRAGVGVEPYADEWYYDGYYYESGFAPIVAFELNVPLGRIGTSANRWVFSPSIVGAYTSDNSANIYSLLHFGYKIYAGNSGLFMPKLGFMTGYCLGGEAGMYGPSCEFAYETRHFVCAANAYYSVGEADGIGASISFGYKF